ncbi:MAG: hypothetical protein E6I43_04470 [Chloroflexi bacterium]|nr:MAG: hypothetical protein E6I43_04470 [Chloroflexota bacterium]
MFRLTSKVKIAAGLAAGALTLGAAGAYAAANANNTITVTPTPITLGSGDHTLNIIGFNGTTTLTLPTGGFKSAGECVSFLAKNKNIALAPQGGTTGSVTLSKNYHGKLMSGANVFCKTQLTTAAKTDKTDTTDTTSATETPETDSADSTASHGHGHAYGHSKHAAV